MQLTYDFGQIFTPTNGQSGGWVLMAVFGVLLAIFLVFYLVARDS